MKSRINDMHHYYADMVRWRRQLHEYPELSFHEHQTSAFIRSLLETWGIEIISGAPGTAVIGRIVSERSGPTVALRADIDALPIHDQKDCAYSSKVPGIMHACGHDAHTAILLELAHWFTDHLDAWSGSILFIFQHAEEVCPGGAAGIVSSGVLDQVNVIYGVHLWTPFPAGHVYSAPGPIMAAADEFEIEITGKGGHGGLPHTAIDSVLIGSHLVVNLQSIVSRNVNPTEPCVVSVGMMQAGTAFNIIAERCRLKGTVRTFNEEVRLDVQARLAHIANETAAMFGAQAVIEYRDGYPSVVNDVAEAKRFAHVATAVFGAQQVHESPRIMASEDFAYYLQQLPGCYMFVGAGNEGKGIIYPHHHPQFDIDEEAMRQAAILLATMTLDYMQQFNANI
ncbi:MAG: amidohydrolase [Paenibacillaceae bacterium]